MSSFTSMFCFPWLVSLNVAPNTLRVIKPSCLLVHSTQQALCAAIHESFSLPSWLPCLGSTYLKLCSSRYKACARSDLAQQMMVPWIESFRNLVGVGVRPRWPSMWLPSNERMNRLLLFPSKQPGFIKRSVSHYRSKDY